MKPPAFQFYASDFLLGTATMSAEEVGAYIRLLCYQWDHGEVPDNDDKLCRLALCDKSCVPALRSKFLVAGTGLKNERMEKERVKQAQYRSRQADFGRKGGLAKATLSQPLGYPKPTLKPPSPSPSPSPSSEILPPAPQAAEKPKERNPHFDSFAVACGTDPFQLTASAARTIGVKLAEIRKASPAVRPEDFLPRALRYRAIFPTASLTPSALCSHWAECDPTQPHHVKPNANPRANDRSYSQVDDYSKYQPPAHKLGS